VLAIALLFFIPVEGRWNLPQLAESMGTKNLIRLDPKVDWTVLSAAYFPKAEVDDVQQAAAFLDEHVGSAELFYDFSNQPVFSHLVPRKPMTRFLAAGYAGSMESQRAVVEDLASQPVKYVVWGYPEALGVPPRPPEITQYGIAEKILQDFQPFRRYGRFIILAPKQPEAKLDPELARAMFRPEYELAGLPYLWGGQGKYAPQEMLRQERFVFGDLKEALLPAGIAATVKGEGVQVATSNQPVSLRLKRNASRKERVNFISLYLLIPGELDGQTAHLSWGQGEGKIRLAFNLKADLSIRRYIFRVGSLPGWVWQEPVEAITLRMPGGGWTCASATLDKVDDIQLRQ
jgi:hypothetical protein